jgi:hypothetical protein
LDTRKIKSESSRWKIKSVKEKMGGSMMMSSSVWATQMRISAEGRGEHECDAVSFIPSTSFWLDKWLRADTLASTFPALYSYLEKV